MTIEAPFGTGNTRSLSVARERVAEDLIISSRPRSPEEIDLFKHFFAKLTAGGVHPETIKAMQELEASIVSQMENSSSQ